MIITLIQAVVTVGTVSLIAAAIATLVYTVASRSDRFKIPEDTDE